MRTVSKLWVSTRISALKLMTPTEDSKAELQYWEKVLRKMNRNKKQVIKL